MHKLNNADDLASLRQILQSDTGRYKSSVTMCAGTACQACGCLPVAKAMENELIKQGMANEVRFCTTGCHGFCEQGPLAIIEPGNIFYRHIKPEDVEEIVSRTLKGGETVDRLFYTDPVSGNPVEKEKDIPFYAAQNRFLLADNPKLSPKNINDYIALGGYAALAKALTGMTPDEVLDEVEGLRPARTRRRRLSHRTQVAAVQDSPGRRALCNLQRRRRRPRGVHGPQFARRQPPRRSGRHD